MDVEVRQLRCLIAIVDEGTFTDAGIALGVSQAAVSRTLSVLEKRLGVQLLRSTSRENSPTAIGLRVVAHARRVLTEVDDLVQEAASGHSELRIGHAWSALGRPSRSSVGCWRTAASKAPSWVWKHAGARWPSPTPWRGAARCIWPISAAASCS